MNIIKSQFTDKIEYEDLLSGFEELISLGNTIDIDLAHEVKLLQQKIIKYRKNKFQSPTPWQRVLMNRDFTRPKIDDYINALFDEWIELHGDRCSGDDAAVVGGIGQFDGLPITIIGYRKGKNTEENLRCNFGMPRPEGFRKIQRLVLQAEKFNRPVLTIIDTPGADPGILAEERGQAWAISQALMTMCQLRVPIVAIITGAGGSAGALVLAISDRLLMFSNAVFSIVSPEVCSQILWRGSEKLEDVVCAMKITSTDLLEMGLIDEVIEEPFGGVNWGFNTIIPRIKSTLKKHMKELLNQEINDLLEQRYIKFRNIGVFNENNTATEFKVAY